MLIGSLATWMGFTMVPCLITVKGCDNVCPWFCVPLLGPLRIEGAWPHVQLPRVIKMAVQCHPPVLELLQSLRYAGCREE